VLTFKKATTAEVQSHLKQLSATAQTLNQLSDKLTGEVAEVEGPVNKLNLGVSAYVVVGKWSDESNHSGETRLAYDKHSGKWGFVVEEITRDEYGSESYQNWLFKDAPRHLRLQVVEAIPQLLEALVKKSGELASDIKDKVTFVEELAGGYKPTVPEDLPLPQSSSAAQANIKRGAKV
jgi:hypothetical protein